MPGAEVAVLGQDDPVLGVGELADLAVGRAVPVGQVRGVKCVVPSIAQKHREPRGQLRVDQDFTPR